MGGKVVSQELPALHLFHESAASNFTDPYRSTPMPSDKDSQELIESDRTASHIAYHLVVSTSNRKMSDDERESIKQVIKDAAVQLNVTLMLALQNRYKLSFEVYAANTGKRSEPIFELEEQ